ncbi:MAG: hypothetical protein RR290_02420, partial [Clostridia bacterium]
FKSNIETYNSEITLYVANEYTSTTGTFRLEDLNKDSSNIKRDVVKSMKNSDVPKFEIQNGLLVYVKNKCTANEIKWVTDVGVKEKSTTPIVAIPTPVGGSVFKDKDNKEVPVPEGFSVDVANNVVNDGLVIKDNNNENEFVWIPSKEISGGFVRRNLRNETFNSSNFNEDYPLDSGEYKEIKDSETKYGGFYVARYEAGLPVGGVTKKTDGTQKPVSKKGSTVWTNIRFAENMADKIGTTDGALKVAKSMYNTNTVKSVLLYPAHVDTIMKWFLDAPTLTNGVGLTLDNKTAYSSSHTDAVGTASNEILQNSSRWGNYHTSSTYKAVVVTTCTGVVKPAGSSDVYRVKNIYDLAGNVFEWSMEAGSVNGRVLRGGYYGDAGAVDPATYRVDNYPSFNSMGCGFRLGIYIK